MVRFVVIQSGAWGWGEGWGTGQRQWKVLQTSSYKTIVGMWCTTDLPWWFSGKRLQLQCRRPKFDPWVGKTRWRSKWQPTPVFLPRKSHGQRSLVGYSPGVMKSQTRLNTSTTTDTYIRRTQITTQKHLFFKKPSAQPGWKHSSTPLYPQPHTRAS